MQVAGSQEDLRVRLHVHLWGDMEVCGADMDTTTLLASRDYLVNREH